MCAMKKSEFKMRIRDEAKRKVKGYSGGIKDYAAHGDRIEAGRRELLIKSAQGGDTNAQRIRAELTYLLNNYHPRYDMRIEHLIEKWRTAHDPSYDVGIHVRYRQVRKEYERQNNAF